MRYCASTGVNVGVLKFPEANLGKIIEALKKKSLDEFERELVDNFLNSFGEGTEKIS